MHNKKYKMKYKKFSLFKMENRLKEFLFKR